MRMESIMALGERTMGKFKQQMIEEMSIEEVKEVLDNFNENKDKGYIEFLEGQLEIAEEKMNKLEIALKDIKGPGKCVECFKVLPSQEIICAECQDECDGRWDHLREEDNKT